MMRRTLQQLLALAFASSDAAAATSPWCEAADAPATFGMYCTADQPADCLAAPLDGVAVDESVKGLFEQGVAQEWNFNHAESRRNFHRVVELAPACAICWWALARSYASNINSKITDMGAFHAWSENASKALKASDPPKVRKLVETIQLLRLPLEQAANETAVLASRRRYADAICDAAASGPLASDGDIGALCADAAMATSSWNYYEHYTVGEGPGPIQPYFAPIWSLLKRLTAPSAVPSALAQHLMIHMAEPRSGEYEKALYGADAADALVDLMPQAGHLQHMPAHLYLRNGHYARGLQASLNAIRADSFYIDRCLCPYGHSHNIDMGVWHSMLLGDLGTSHRLARVHKEDAARYGAFPRASSCFHMVTNYSGWESLVGIRFGRWNDVLQLGFPSCKGRAAMSWLCQRHLPAKLFAYGMAAEAMISTDESIPIDSNAALSKLAALSSRTNPAATAVAGWHELSARRAVARGELELAIGLMRNLTVFLEDSLYTEPPTWYYPTWDCLGTLLLRSPSSAARAAEAVSAFEKSLSVFPRSGWALLGLSQAHTALGHTEHADAYRRQHEAEWAYADVDLLSACPQFDSEPPPPPRIRSGPPTPPPHASSPQPGGTAKAPAAAKNGAWVFGVGILMFAGGGVSAFCAMRVWKRRGARTKLDLSSLIPSTYITSSTEMRATHTTQRVPMSVEATSIGVGVVDIESHPAARF